MTTTASIIQMSTARPQKWLETLPLVVYLLRPALNTDTAKLWRRDRAEHVNDPRIDATRFQIGTR